MNILPTLHEPTSVDTGLVALTINGEELTTTPEHPFYELDAAPWLAVGARAGRWTPAGELKVGDHIQQADGTTGVVQSVVFEATEQVMYNMTVADTHTFFVGDGKWLVHNACGSASARDFIASHGISGDGATKKVIRLAQEMKENGFQNIPSVSVITHEGKLIVVDGHPSCCSSPIGTN